MKLDLDQAGAPPPPIIPPGRRVGAASEHPRRNQPKGTASNEGDGNDGGFQMIRTEYIQSATVIAAEKARDAYREFVERQLSRYSSKEMVLYDFQRDDHGGLITIANLPNATPISEAAAPVNVRTIRITIEQLEQINSAAPEAQSDLVRQLLPQSRDTALVAYTNPFSVRTTSYKEGVNSFAFQLQRNAAESRIYRDPLSSATLNNVRALSARLVGRGTDYVAYIDDGSFKMTDFNIVQDIKKILTSSGIKIVTGVPKSVSFGHNKNVIVITAHSDAQLSAFIDSLGKAGAFKDNYVVLNSCETPLTGDMADRIMQKYGAKAAFLHQGLIPASKVQDLLVNLTADIKAHSQRSLVDTLRDAVRQVGLNGIWSICEYLRGAHMGIQNG